MSVFWSNLSYEIKNNAVYSICLFIADSVYSSGLLFVGHE